MFFIEFVKGRKAHYVLHVSPKNNYIIVLNKQRYYNQTCKNMHPIQQTIKNIRNFVLVTFIFVVKKLQKSNYALDELTSVGVLPPKGENIELMNMTRTYFLQGMVLNCCFAAELLSRKTKSTKVRKMRNEKQNKLDTTTVATNSKNVVISNVHLLEH